MMGLFWNRRQLWPLFLGTISLLLCPTNGQETPRIRKAALSIPLAVAQRSVEADDPSPVLMNQDNESFYQCTLVVTMVTNDENYWMELSKVVEDVIILDNHGLIEDKQYQKQFHHEYMPEVTLEFRVPTKHALSAFQSVQDALEKRNVKITSHEVATKRAPKRRAISSGSPNYQSLENKVSNLRSESLETLYDDLQRRADTLISEPDISDKIGQFFELQEGIAGLMRWMDVEMYKIKGMMRQEQQTFMQGETSLINVEIRRENPKPAWWWSWTRPMWDAWMDFSHLILHGLLFIIIYVTCWLVFLSPFCFGLFVLVKRSAKNPAISAWIMSKLSPEENTPKDQ